MSGARGVLGVYLRNRNLKKKRKEKDSGVLALTHERLQPRRSHVSASAGGLQRMAGVDPFFVSLYLDGCSRWVLFPIN